MESSFLVDLSLANYAAILGASLVASLIAGLGGFGGGFIVVIALEPIIGAKAVIPLVAVFAFFSNVSRVYFYRKYIQWKIAIQLILSSLPGVWIGSEVFVQLPERLLLLLLGISLIVLLPLRRYLRYKNFTPGLFTIICIGLLFGFVSGTSVGSGLFVIAGLASSGVEGMALMGTDALIGTVNAVSRGLAYYLHGALPPELILGGCLMSIGTMPGTWAASKVVHRMGTKNHTYLIEAIILIGGCRFLYEALTSPVQP